jgi:beta-galactosidase
MTTSTIRRLGGVPTLFVNGKAQPGLAYITYLQERNCYADFAAAGYRLFSFTTHFGDQGINAVTGIHAFSPGIFDAEGEADYSLFDETVAEILKACPDAQILPRVNMALPTWWELKHPEACNDTGLRNDHPRSCFSSGRWRDATEAYLRDLIAHVEASPFRDHVIGYQIAGGNTEEWFSFDQMGSQGPASRERFARECPGERSEAEYRQFLSDVVAESIVHFAGVAKECTGRRLVVGSFYGYTLEVPFWESGHHALQKILNCRDIDFLCSPASYMNQRQPGQDWADMTVLDSLKLHGKLYFAEYDTRTHLTKPLAECRENSCEPDTYCAGVWLGPDSPEVSRGVLRANFARQLSHGHGSWWFDMWGGWYADEAIMRDLATFVSIAEEALSAPSRASTAQVAVVVDERAYAHLSDRTLAQRCCYHNRRPLGLTGTPYDIYDVSDLGAIRERYQAFVFLCPYRTPAMAAAMQDCEAHGVPILVADEQAPDLSVERLRDFYKRQNLHCWCDTDDVIHASAHYIAIHAATTGEKRLRLDATRRITPLLDPAPSFAANRIVLTLQAFETRLFRLDPLA